LLEKKKKRKPENSIHETISGLTFTENGIIYHEGVHRIEYSEKYGTKNLRISGTFLFYFLISPRKHIKLNTEFLNFVISSMAIIDI